MQTRPSGQAGLRAQVPQRRARPCPRRAGACLGAFLLRVDPALRLRPQTGARGRQSPQGVQAGWRISQVSPRLPRGAGQVGP